MISYWDLIPEIQSGVPRAVFCERNRVRTIVYLLTFLFGELYTIYTTYTILFVL